MKTLSVGDKVPNFSAKDQHGEMINLSDYIGKKIIIFFYPRANTPGCTAQACDLRDNYDKLTNAGYNLIGVSADSIKNQLSFSNKFSFPFSLLSDEDRTIINIFGVWGPKKFRGKDYEGIHRITFIINEEGIINRVIDKVITKDHASQIL
ncbi:MAG: thioredoxin-dependent thiol peroxidase [Flavobacteriaceae bacterium]|nr:thioredoxin-dependent thiol peroxidase [Flavobacteriaceae bacterium]|tara:strand:- start:1034 stop:1483 length:450 start_codon:yes stop_codon:yes gene_type:complete